MLRVYIVYDFFACFADVDSGLQKTLINGFALAAKFGVSASWAAIMAFTTEVYPTVVRYVYIHCNNCRCTSSYKYSLR